MNSQWLIVGTAVGWLALFVGSILILAYRRASLPMSTCILLLLFAAYWIFGAAPLAWKIAVSLPFAVLLLLNIRPLRVTLVTRPFMRKYRKLLPAMSATEREALDAGTVWWDGELFTRRAELAKAHVGKSARAYSDRAGIPRRTLRGTVRDARRLGHHPSPRRHARPGVGIHQSAWLLCDDHSAALRRAGILRIRTLLRADQDRFAVDHRLFDHCGTKLPGSCGTAAALRYRGAKRALPAAARAWRGCPVFRPDGPARRFGRRFHSRHGCHLQGAVAGR